MEFTENFYVEKLVDVKALIKALIDFMGSGSSEFWRVQERNRGKRRVWKEDLFNKLSQNSDHFYNSIMDNVYFKFRENAFPNFRYKLTF
ncbi:hypothetical protein [Methanosarcina mazei]|uniref:Uncharacterized protein n=1 Tax=Methanosarcina mazei TaxID=2209 RepID=A0A0F8LAV8_METMZ|nr:hypothetical protein [Methanosarcina mazei]KKH23107.1 hypothetical protein DU58_16620 [Methanosarcina mazei]